MSLSEDNPIKPIQEAEVVLSFITAAKSYCTNIESYQAQGDTEFLLLMQANLLALYQAGNKLPNTYHQDSEDFKQEASDKFIEKITSLIADRLMDNRYYLHLFNPTDESDRDIVYGDLLDDLGDIYKDLKQSLLIFDNGTNEAKERAIWKFKFTFDHHWGDHCINAIYALHYFLKKGK